MSFSMFFSPGYPMCSWIQNPSSVVGGEVVMGAAISDQDEEADEFRHCMDTVSIYLHAAEPDET
jgi:hypothetical protein